MPTENSAIESLVKGYYASLQAISGGNNFWYQEHNGVEFRAIINGVSVELSLDAGLNENQMRDASRRLSVNLEIKDLRRAFDMFGLLATRYCEGQPIGFGTDKSDATMVKINAQGHLEQIPSDWDNERGFKGDLHSVRSRLVDLGIGFSHAYAIGIPTGVHGITLYGNTRRPEGIYQVSHALVDAESRVIEYARTIDRAISQQ